MSPGGTQEAQVALSPFTKTEIDFASPTARRMAEALKRANLLATPARILILVFLSESPVRHHSAISVVSGLFARGTAPCASTIKQNMARLQRHGLLDVVRAGRGDSVYALNATSLQAVAPPLRRTTLLPDAFRGVSA